MKRSVRSGIAIAGLAGGFWLLGQAVADASTGADSTAGGATVASSGNASSDSGGTTAAAASGEQDNSGSGGNDQSVDATNETSNDADGGNVNAGGGTSTVGVVAGNGNTATASSGSGDVTAKQDVTTVVWVDSSATGTKVSGSGNAAAGNNASYSANAKGTQNSSGGRHSGGNSQDVSASNYTDNDADGGNINAGGGLSAVGVLAGNGNTLGATSGKHHESHCDNEESDLIAASSKHEGCESGDRHHENDGNVDASQNVNTKITVGSSATGADVSDSGNAAAGNNASYSANANGAQKNESDSKGHHHDKWNDCKENDSSASLESGSGDCGWSGDWHHHNGNSQDVDASNGTENDADGGNVNAGGGTSVVGVIAGNGNTLYCTSKTGNVTCSQNITTIINIISKATGSTVTCSANAAAGNTGHIVCQETVAPAKPVVNKPASHKPTASKPVKAMVPASHHKHHHATTMSSAQPSGELAFTGAETSLPLTLGLLALGAGGALTLAGRRRETAAV